jgi:hypothetical protein
MTKWDVRIEVRRSEIFVGSFSIKGVVTETLPRVGERILFGHDIVSAKLQGMLPLTSADMPMVAQVEHLVGLESTQVVVVLRIAVSPNTSDTALELLRDVREEWCPHAR